MFYILEIIDCTANIFYHLLKLNVLHNTDYCDLCYHFFLIPIFRHDIKLN